MANRTGKNSPSSFDEFAPTKAYGAQQKQADLKKAAPVAGNSQMFLGTPRRATEIALENVRKARAQAAQQPQGPDMEAPPTIAPAAAPDPYQTLWQAAAETPGASNLVKEYAAMA